jgi:hypothetical protein
VDAFIYQADLICPACAKKINARLSPDQLASEDSDDAPQGPFADGGGEADRPQHCGMCGEHLENPLTGAGYEYVEECSRDRSSHCDVIRCWRQYYG